MVTKYFINISYYLLFLNYQSSKQNTLNGYQHSRKRTWDMQEIVSVAGK